MGSRACRGQREINQWDISWEIGYLACRGQREASVWESMGEYGRAWESMGYRGRSREISRLSRSKGGRIACTSSCTSEVRSDQWSQHAPSCTSPPVLTTRKAVIVPCASREVCRSCTRDTSSSLLGAPRKNSASTPMGIDAMEELEEETDALSSSDIADGARRNCSRRGGVTVIAAYIDVLVTEFS